MESKNKKITWRVLSILSAIVIFSTGLVGMLPASAAGTAPTGEAIQRDTDMLYDFENPSDKVTIASGAARLTTVNDDARYAHDGGKSLQVEIGATGDSNALGWCRVGFDAGTLSDYYGVRVFMNNPNSTAARVLFFAGINTPTANPGSTGTAWAGDRYKSHNSTGYALNPTDGYVSIDLPFSSFKLRTGDDLSAHTGSAMSDATLAEIKYFEIRVRQSHQLVVNDSLYFDSIQLIKKRPVIDFEEDGIKPTSVTTAGRGKSQTWEAENNTTTASYTNQNTDSGQGLRLDFGTNNFENSTNLEGTGADVATDAHVTTIMLNPASALSGSSFDIWFNALPDVPTVDNCFHVRLGFVSGGVSYQYGETGSMGGFKSGVTRMSIDLRKTTQWTIADPLGGTNNIGLYWKSGKAYLTEKIIRNITAFKLMIIPYPTMSNGSLIVDSFNTYDPMAGEDTGAAQYDVTDDSGVNGAVTFDGRTLSYGKAEQNNDVILNVVPDAGYVLKAGSLLVTDENDTPVCIPERYNFRSAGDSMNAFTFKMPAKNVKVKAEFVPANAGALNIGYVGSSINPASSGIRFVYRMYKTLDDKITIGGTQYELKSYGMLITSKEALGTGALDFDNDNQKIVTTNVKVSNRKYDECRGYIDFSTMIVNLNSVKMKSSDIVARAYAVYEDGGGQDQIVYGETITRKYNDYVS